MAKTKSEAAASAAGAAGGADAGTNTTAQGAGGAVITHLHVRALVDGFRRAGRAWPSAGIDVPAEDFTGEQIDQILAEPQLVVTPVANPRTE